MLRENSLRSASRTAAGMCFGSELIAKPNSTSCSDRDADDHREREPVALQLDEFLADDAEPARPGKEAVHGGCPPTAASFRVAHQVDEHVLEPRLHRAPSGSACRRETARAPRSSRCRVAPDDVQPAAERRDLLDRGKRAQLARERRKVGTLDRPADERLPGDRLPRRCPARAGGRSGCTRACGSARPRPCSAC